MNRRTNSLKDSTHGSSSQPNSPTTLVSPSITIDPPKPTPVPRPKELSVTECYNIESPVVLHVPREQEIISEARGAHHGSDSSNPCSTVDLLSIDGSVDTLNLSRDSYLRHDWVEHDSDGSDIKLAESFNRRKFEDLPDSRSNSVEARIASMDIKSIVRPKQLSALLNKSKVADSSSTGCSAAASLLTDYDHHASDSSSGSLEQLSMQTLRQKRASKIQTNKCEKCCDSSIPRQENITSVKGDSEKKIDHRSLGIIPIKCNSEQILGPSKRRTVNGGPAFHNFTENSVHVHRTLSNEPPVFMLAESKMSNVSDKTEINLKDTAEGSDHDYCDFSDGAGPALSDIAEGPATVLSLHEPTSGVCSDLTDVEESLDVTDIQGTSMYVHPVLTHPPPCERSVEIQCSRVSKLGCVNPNLNKQSISKPIPEAVKPRSKNKEPPSKNPSSVSQPLDFSPGVDAYLEEKDGQSLASSHTSSQSLYKLVMPSTPTRQMFKTPLARIESFHSQEFEMLASDPDFNLVRSPSTATTPSSAVNTPTVPCFGYKLHLHKKKSARLKPNKDKRNSVPGEKNDIHKECIRENAETVFR